MSEPQAIAGSHHSTRNLLVGSARERYAHSGNVSPDRFLVDEVSDGYRESVPGISRPRDICKDDLSRDDLTGLFIGQYALGRNLGAGGMGTVFAARHVRLDKQFAMKFIGTEMADLSEAQARFDQEVLALGQLRHTNIVNAIDAGCSNGLKYLVTELADGKDFTRLVEQRGAISVANACELIRQTAMGLAHSHRAGFLHRDIKPSNLILDRSGIVKILDFGLVRNESDKCRLTGDSRMLGTLDFMAPEQAHDASQVDERADIYSLGCTLLYLLSGQPPFSDARYSSMAAKLKGHLFDQPEWLVQVPRSIPKSLVKLLERMTAKSPSDRIQSAQEIADELVPLASDSNLSILTGTEIPGLSAMRNQSRFRSDSSSVLQRWIQASAEGAEQFPDQNEAESQNSQTTSSFTANSAHNHRWGRAWRVAICGSIACFGFAAFNAFNFNRNLSVDFSRKNAPKITSADALNITSADAINIPKVASQPEPFPPKAPEYKLPQIVSFEDALSPSQRKHSRRPPQVRIQTW